MNTQVDTCACCANGCEMLGTSSRSTTGGDWVCFIHAGTEPGRWQRVTAKLNRLSWLVYIVRDIRARAGSKPWSTILVEARKQVVACQRSDLYIKENESPQDWMIRLEGVLAHSCRAMFEADDLIKPPQEEPPQ